MSAAPRTLVTGAGGFVGRHLVLAWQAEGAEVVGTREPSASDGELPFPSVPVDLRDFDTVRAAVRDARPDTVVHLAGQSSAALSFERPRDTYAVNAGGTVNLLEAVRAERPEARVLVVGSGEIYGPQPEGSRVGEDASLRPVSPYGLSKAAADAAAEAYVRLLGLQVVRTRSFAHVGPGQSPQFAIPAFARQIAEAEGGLGEPVLRVGNLNVVRDLTDVRDVVAAYWCLCEEGRPGLAYNVCSGQGTHLGRLAEQMARMARVPMRIEVDPARLRPADVPYLVGDPSRLGQETGWRPLVSVERSVRDVLEEWRARVTGEAAAAGTS